MCVGGDFPLVNLLHDLCILLERKWKIWCSAADSGRALTQAGGEKSPLSNRKAEVLYISGWIVFLHFMSRCSCVPKGGGDHTAKWKDLNAFCLSRAGREKFNSCPPMTDFSREREKCFIHEKLTFHPAARKATSLSSLFPKSRRERRLIRHPHTREYTDLTEARQILSPALLFYSNCNNKHRKRGPEIHHARGALLRKEINWHAKVKLQAIKTFATHNKELQPQFCARKINQKASCDKTPSCCFICSACVYTLGAQAAGTWLFVLLFLHFFPLVLLLFITQSLWW